MKLHDIDVVSPQALQAAVDTLCDHRGIPVVALKARGMAAFGHQEEVATSMRYRAADLLLAVAVAGSGIDQIQAVIEGGAEDLRDGRH